MYLTGVFRGFLCPSLKLCFRKLTMTCVEQKLVKLLTKAGAAEDAIVIDEATRVLNDLLVCTILSVLISCFYL